MTHYIASYDTENPGCLAACGKIVKIHEKYDIPATFFVVGKRLEENPNEYRDLLDHPLFEVASHTYSHKMLKDNPFCGNAVPEDERRAEILKGKEAVERVFDRPCLGIRPGCSFDDGLLGASDVLQTVSESGLLYVSSFSWGPNFTLPALLTEPFTYAEDGFRELWELPAHGWHDNLLKDNNGWGPQRIGLWPPAMPEAIPSGFISAPEEEFAINRIFLDKAIEDDMTFVSLIWHPWSLDAFDPEMRMLELTFDHVQKLQLKPCTYADLYYHLSG